MTHKGYETDARVLVLSADLAGGLVPPEALLNHVPLTRIYGDGKVVFIDPAKGPSVICEGHLDTKQIEQLFALLQAKGFFGFSESYVQPGPTDLPTDVITATRRGEPEHRVACYGGAVSAPPGCMECYHALLYPQLQPSDVRRYERQPISAHDLEAGFYDGLEYQKKLDTPRDWAWLEAGKSSRWHKPAGPAHTVILDSGYMIPRVDNCRHITVHYSTAPEIAGSTIQFDRNSMSPNKFGDIGISTCVYFAPRPASFRLLETEDNKHLFSITVPGYSGPKLRLVVFGKLARPTAGRLLVVDAHAVIQHSYALQVIAQD
jgi:hypothetical protein